MKAPPDALPWVTAKDAADRLDITLGWLYVLLERGVYQAERVGEDGGWRIFVDARGWPLRAPGSSK